jgi:hypothetical protein
MLASVYLDAPRERLIVAPPEHWTGADAQLAIDATLSLLGDKRLHFVGDCRRMVSYQTDARVRWQRAFGQMRRQLRSVVFVGVRSPVIRLGIATMSLFSSIPMSVVPELEGLRDGAAPSSPPVA